MIFDVTFEESKQTFNATFKEVEIIDNTRPVVIEPLEIIENGEYYAENIDGFNPVNVNIPLRYDEGFRDGFQASQDSIVLQEKTATENGEVTADEGFTGMSKVTVAVPIKDEQEKTVEITKNGTTEVVADEGTSMSKVTVKTNVALEGDIGKPYIDTSKMTDYSYFFYNRARLEVINGVDTSNCTSFEYAFAECYKKFLQELMPLINTEKGETFTGMFYNCSQLQSVPQLDTSNGTSFKEMFYGCRNLKSIPLLNTSKGTAFSSMFYDCEMLKSIPHIDTSKGTILANMFNGCERLEDIPNLDTSSCQNFNAVFYGCKKIKSIPQLDTSKGTMFKEMFRDCSALENVPPINTSKGTTFDGMFYDCTALQAVELTTAKSNLSTSTFKNCTALTSVTIGEGWAVNIYLHYSDALTQESLHGMIENLADRTGQTAKTFQVGATNLAKIDEEHINMLKSKNWNYS